MPHRLLPLTLVATLGASLTAQTGRTMSLLAPPRIGATAQLQVTYPVTEAGNYGYYYFSGHQVGTVPWTMPGYTMLGSARVNLFLCLYLVNFQLASTGVSTLSFALPNDPSIQGFALDVQEVDLNPATSTIAWSDNDLELTVAGPGPTPLPNFVPIPAGTFLMGSTAGAPQEQPVHQVTITQPFWIGKYEVTQAEYQAVMGTNPSYFPGANRPVEQVTWNQAMAYCRALTVRERNASAIPADYQYRLPTEAEWEYCCRAGTATEWNTGASLSVAQANLNNPSSGQTVDVGLYSPNAFGLFDTHGNVWEWCLDAWDGSSNYPTSAIANPYVTAGSDRILRGGAWNSVSVDCRSARRYYFSPGSYSSIGFRVVLAPIVGIPLPNFVAIPAGTFQMGSTAGNANEQPVHPVTITQPFWMGKYEVTHAEYQAVMGGIPSSFPGSRPVEGVSWNYAMAYCAALTTSEGAAGRVPAGYQYRLPTEAEWEYCCRAGTTTEWNTGTSLNYAQANFIGIGGQTVNVGSYAANAFGLFDMHGNVWEWCLDAWDGSNNYSSSAVSDPYVTTGPYRVFRGGGYYVSADYCRSAARGYAPSGYGINLMGFRVVLAPVLVP